MELTTLEDCQEGHDHLRCHQEGDATISQALCQSIREDSDVEEQHAKLD